VLEKERERIKAMEKRSLHYVQHKIHDKTSWIDERKSKVTGWGAWRGVWQRVAMDF
jgi:hypothetical protein